MLFPSANELPIGNVCADAALFLGKRYSAPRRSQTNCVHFPLSEISVSGEKSFPDQRSIHTVDQELVKIATVAQARATAGHVSQPIADNGDLLIQLRAVSRRCYVESGRIF